MAGRPPKPPEERREYTLRIRLTVHERVVIEAAAQHAHCDISSWAREILVRRAERQSPKSSGS